MALKQWLFKNERLIMSVPIPKSEQLKKIKKINPKRMTKIERKLYEEFICDKALGKCQSDCYNNGVEYHHSQRGAYKDDRSIVLICRRCHTLIHNCEYKNADESLKLTLLAKSRGLENWKEYTTEV